MPIKIPNNKTIVILLFSVIFLTTLLYFIGKPKLFVFDAASGNSKILCNCFGRVEKRDESRERCRGIVFKCDKVEF